LNALPTFAAAVPVAFWDMVIQVRPIKTQTTFVEAALAAQKFAEALESIPTALASNAGLDPIDSQVELRAKHAEGGIWFGIEAHEAKVKDMYKEQVFEPVAVKEQIIKSATEAASMILRIDDVILSGKSKAPAGPPGGMGEMGGMGRRRLRLSRLSSKNNH
jgi:archaeal chaperonin